MIKESDWKHLRKLHPVALERFSQRILEEVKQVSADQTISVHERYLKVFRLIRDRDKDMAGAFDDMRRSRAHLRLLGMHSLGVLTEDEIAGFSEDMRSILG